MRVAYFINQYPAVSHTFIRREIRALEDLDVSIVRYAIWSDVKSLLDPDDIAEQKLTRYILQTSYLAILKYITVAIVASPIALINVTRLALKIGRHSDRGILRHLAYVVEALILATWCRRDSIQHIHAHFGTNSTAIAMLASKLTGIPYSFTAHGSEEFEKAPLLSLDVKLSNATFARCVSAFGKSQLMRWSTPDQWPKISVVHCGVDTTFSNAELTKPSVSPRFVCVGRLGEHKAQLVLVAAAGRLREMGKIFEIVLVGDGPMRPLIEKATQKSKLENQISITGWVSGDRVKAEILAARALVLPSFSENMPVVIMEAMALGRPVISTYIAGIPELVQPGKTGWLVSASDDVALAAALAAALEASVEKMADMGAAGRAWIAKHHDVKKEAGSLKALFESATKD